MPKWLEATQKLAFIWKTLELLVLKAAVYDNCQPQLNIRSTGTQLWLINYSGSNHGIVVRKLDFLLRSQTFLAGSSSKLSKVEISKFASGFFAFLPTRRRRLRFFEIVSTVGRRVIMKLFRKVQSVCFLFWCSTSPWKLRMNSANRARTRGNPNPRLQEGMLSGGCSAQWAFNPTEFVMKCRDTLPWGTPF